MTSPTRCYPYRAIDRDGNLLDFMLSDHRNRTAARRFLRSLLEVTGRKPARLTTDRHPAYKRAIRWTWVAGHCTARASTSTTERG